MPRGGRGADHAAHVGTRGEQGEDAGFHAAGGERVRARDAGLRTGERQLRDDARDGPGDGPADRGQPALDPRAARADRHLPRVHPGLQPRRQDPQAVHRVLRRHGQGERPVLQHGHRRREELDRTGHVKNAGKTRELAIIKSIQSARDSAQDSARDNARARMPGHFLPGHFSALTGLVGG